MLESVIQEYNKDTEHFDDFQVMRYHQDTQDGGRDTMKSEVSKLALMRGDSSPAEFQYNDESQDNETCAQKTLEQNLFDVIVKQDKMSESWDNLQVKLNNLLSFHHIELTQKSQREAEEKKKEEEARFSMILDEDARKAFKPLVSKFKDIRRCYRGTENGFKPTDFHERCDNKQALLVLV